MRRARAVPRAGRRGTPFLPGDLNIAAEASRAERAAEFPPAAHVMNDNASIWFDGFPLDLVRRLSRACLPGRLGIDLIEAGSDYLKARMPVDERTRQPDGLLHGGGSAALAETLASLASTFVVDRSKHSCVGLEINANHLRGIRGGFVYGTAKPLHLGRTTHVWEVRITGEDAKLVCISRVTTAVLDRPSGHVGRGRS